MKYGAFRNLMFTQKHYKLSVIFKEGKKENTVSFLLCIFYFISFKLYCFQCSTDDHIHMVFFIECCDFDDRM